MFNETTSRREPEENALQHGRRILILIFIASLLIVLGIGSAVYWRLHHERAITGHDPTVRTQH